MFMYVNDIPFFSGGSGGSGASIGLSEQDKEILFEIIDKASEDRIRQILENDIVAFEIPDGTTQVATYEFQNNGDLRRVVAPDTLQEIGNNAFEKCFRLTGIDGLGGLIEIKSSAFLDCYSFTDIEFPETLEIIGDMAFRNCYSLQNKDLILPNCKQISAQAFQSCGFTGRLELPKCEVLKSWAFSGSNFSSLVLSSALTTYDTYSHALSGCSNLEFVDLGTDFNCDNFILSMSTKYSVETLVGVLNSLKDRTGETAYNLTLGATNLAKLTDEQKAIATNKNWVLK